MNFKIKRFRLYIIRRIYSLWYGIKIEKGFKYQKIRHSNLFTLECHHYLMLSTGWIRYTDIDAGVFSVWCWYRKETDIVESLNIEP